MAQAHEGPEGAGDAEVVEFLRGVIAFRLAERRVQGLVSEHLGLAVSDVLALAMLVRGDRTVGRLAAELELTPGSASLLVKRLTAAGMARRVPSTTDRRSVRIELTEHGAETAAAVRDRYAVVIRAAAASLPQASLAAATELLSETARHLRDRGDEPAS